MSRSLALFAIGLIFGGTAGFLVAASNGITLDGHDHSKEVAANHGAGHGTSKHDGHDAAHNGHDKPISLPASPTAPSIKLDVQQDLASGWNVNIRTENFRFTPENASTKHILGEGHAHLYINEKKIARLYSPWFHISELQPGKHTVRVTLNANDHRPLMVDGFAIEASQSITVK